MSRELNFQNGIDVIKYQDSTNHLDLSLTVDGVPFDLSQLDSLTLKIGNSNGYVMSKQVDLSTISDPQSGNVSIHLDDGTMTKLVPDDYNIEVWVEINPVSIVPQADSVNVTVSDSGLAPVQSIFPSDGNLSFTIDDNIKASPTNSINAYVIDDVWDTIQQWKTDTANTISASLSSQLLNEITHWQGDISDSLKKELLQALMNDESTIQKQLNDILTQSLDDLINKEVSDAKSDISKQLNDAMIADVAQQIANLKPQVTNDLHTQLTNELSSELSSAIQQWENSTDSDLNNKLAQAIVQKTNDMQGTLSTQLTNYLAGQLSNYEQNATNTITTNITNQVTQSISNLFSQEDSSLRADLEGLVKGTIQNDVTNTLQQMQQNGDIYATKQQFTDFKNGVNDLISKLNIASDISTQIDVINTQLSQIPTMQQTLKGLQTNALQYMGKVNSPDAANQQGIYKSFDGDYSSVIIVFFANDVLLQFRIDTWSPQGATFTSNGDYHIKTRFSMDNGKTWNNWMESATIDDVQTLQSTINNTINTVQGNINTSITNVQNNINTTIQNVSNMLSDLKSKSLDGVVDNIPNNDLNQATEPGVYFSTHGNIANAPQDLNGAWFKVDIHAGANMTFQALKDWNCNEYIRILSGYPAQWKPWKKIVSQDDLNTVANQLQSSINTLTTDYNNLYSSAVAGGNSVASGTDLNTVQANGIYSLNWQTSSAFSNAFYPGNGLDLVVLNSNGYIVQQVFSNDSSGYPHVNYRVFANNWWSRWIQIGTLDDINNMSSNTLTFKGDIPGNALYQVTASGIYNLAGKTFTDWGNSQLWGQLTVVNTGGVCNQTLRNNNGNMWVQTLNSWGNTGWQQIH